MKKDFITVLPDSGGGDAQFQFASPYPNCKEAAYEHWIVREIVDGGLASKYAYFYLPTL